MNTVTFLGQVIRLSSDFLDYEDLVQSREKIASTDVARVQFLLETVIPRSRFSSYSECLHELGKFVFPGYGTDQKKLLSNGTHAIFRYVVDIPMSPDSRVFIVQRGELIEIIDDFIMNQSRALSLQTGRMEGCGLLFFNHSGSGVDVSTAKRIRGGVGGQGPLDSSMGAGQ